MAEKTDHPKNLIYLTGFMGSGKSTIGPILANTLGFDFADIDTLIEQRVGKKIKEIFRDEGEAFFRDVERRILEDVSHSDRAVISLGGGTLVNPANFGLVQSSGILVYLYSSPEQLLQRLQHKTDRPVLTDSEGSRLDPAQLRDRIMKLYAARSPIYARAHFTVDTDELKVGYTVDEIVKHLSHMLK